MIYGITPLLRVIYIISFYRASLTRDLYYLVSNEEVHASRYNRAAQEGL
jgi:hypothetical protein